METINRNRVLVIEDEDPIRRFIAINLEINGFQVAEAASGSAAMASFAAGRPDVVVLDIMLPDTDGFEICMKLRAIDPGVVILFLSARGQDLDKIRGLELGADDYIVKPFNPLETTSALLNLPNILNKIAPYMLTDMDIGKMIKLAVLGYKVKADTITALQLPPMDAMKEETIKGAAVITVDQTKLKAYVKDQLDSASESDTGESVP